MSNVYRVKLSLMKKEQLIGGLLFGLIISLGYFFANYPVYVSRYKNIGIVNNGLKIDLRNNTSYKFIVNSAKEWHEALA